MVSGQVKKSSAKRGRVMLILLAALLTAVTLYGYYLGRSIVGS
jgi:hypothetical protein